MRGHNHGLGGIAHLLDRLLKLLDVGTNRLKVALHGRLRHLAQVGPHAEVFAFVADDEPAQVRVVLNVIDDLVQPAHHLLSECIGLRAELKERHAIAHVEQGRFVVLPERAIGIGFYGCEFEFICRGRVVDIGGICWPIHLLGLAIAAIKGRVIASGEGAYPVGQGVIAFVKGVEHSLKPERIPHFERAHLPAKAPPNGTVDVGGVVGDFANPVGAVG